ncbi:MAG: hypothetical protein JWM80_4786, partial [Cyanobacteria bacterium RYN_339]|nr:hypothetical protein [Cyanobacteria bacterium RYN_339]
GIILTLLFVAFAPVGWVEIGAKCITLILLALYFVLVYERCLDYLRLGRSSYRAFAYGVVAINALSVIPIFVAEARYGFPMWKSTFDLVLLIALFPILIGANLLAHKQSPDFEAGSA